MKKMLYVLLTTFFFTSISSLSLCIKDLSYEKTCNFNHLYLHTYIHTCIHAYCRKMHMTFLLIFFGRLGNPFNAP